MTKPYEGGISINDSIETLLANEKFTQAFPSLIRALNGDVLAAVVLQAINYRAHISKPDEDGEVWVDLRVSEIADEIGISKQQAQRALNKLRSYSLLMEKQHDGYNNMKMWRIDIDGLRELQVKSNPNQDRNRIKVESKSNQGRFESDVSTYIEETFKEQIRTTRTYGDEITQLSNLLADLIEANGINRPTVTDKWHQEIERLNRLDGYSFEQIERTIRWVQQDSFWRSNVLSPAKLRKQFGALQLKMNTNTGLSGWANVINKLSNQSKELGQ